MELDFPAIKALSSPTRIKMLHRLLEKEATPTTLSETVGKSKSTVSSHLTILEEAGLVEKDKEEGRRRVTYAPTRKAKAIMEGRERTVKFSVASSVLTAVAGVAVLGTQFLPDPPAATGGDQETGGSLAMETMDAAPSAGGGEAQPLLDTLLTTDTFLTVLGVFLVLAGVSIIYLSFLLWRLNNAE